MDSHDGRPGYPRKQGALICIMLMSGAWGQYAGPIAPLSVLPVRLEAQDSEAGAELWMFAGVGMDVAIAEPLPTFHFHALGCKRSGRRNGQGRQQEHGLVV